MQSSVWIGYGMIVDASFWTGDFEFWFAQQYHSQVAFEYSSTVLLIPVATTEKQQAEWYQIIELPSDTVFAFDGVAAFLPEQVVQSAREYWSQFRRDAEAVGFLLPEGQLLFAHLADWDRGYAGD